MHIPKLLCFFILSSIQAIHAQQTFTGHIIDAETKRVIPYATVTAVSAQTILANEAGEFELRPQIFPLTLQISHLGYQTTSVQLNSEQTGLIIINMTPRTFQLPEVKVGNPALAIIREATEKAMLNYEHIFPAKAFLRQMAYQAGKPAYLQEIWFDASWTAFGLIKWNPTQSRRITAGKGINYTNFSFSTLIFSGYLPNNVLLKPLSKKAESWYIFKLTGTMDKNGQEIARISCIPRKGITGVRFEGDYYINTVTNDVVYIDGLIREMNFQGSGHLSVENKESRITAQFRLNKQGQNVLEYATFNLLNRLKIAGAGKQQDTELYNTLYLTGLALSQNAALQDVNPDINDQTLVQSMHTNPEFWQKNPGISRTAKEQQAIKELEEKTDKSY